MELTDLNKHQCRKRGVSCTERVE